MAVEDSIVDEQLRPARSQLGIGSSQHSLSMREKSQLKRRINKEHNSNFRAGYININEEYLHKTGIRGRKSYLLCCFIGVLVVMALFNSMLTAWLVYKFRIFHIGMLPMEFLPEGGSMRFLEEVDIRTMKMSNSRLGGRYDSDLNLIAVNTTMLLGAKYMSGSKLALRGSKISIYTDNFTINYKRSGKSLFSTGDQKIYVPLKHAKNLHALSVQVKKLKSRKGYQDIVFESHKHITVLGAEGVDLNGESGVIIQPYGSVILNATKGAMHMEFGKGFVLDKRLPKVTPKSRIDLSLVNYKLCVCSKNGLVFGVRAMGPGSGCASVSELNHPCKM